VPEIAAGLRITGGTREQRTPRSARAATARLPIAFGLLEPRVRR
jgi:hypothetical protein